jgi:NADPH-dependent glutamate synthase beta subunit-like oxidoreductase
MQRGQSLIVWAIDDGRRAAAAIHRFLAGND